MRAWRYLGYAAVFKLALVAGVGACAALGIEPWWMGAMRELRRALMEPVPKYTADRNASSPSAVWNVSNAGDGYVRLTRCCSGGPGGKPGTSVFDLTNRSDEIVYIRVDESGVPMDFGDFQSPSSDVRFDVSDGHVITLTPGEQYKFTLPLAPTERLRLPLRYYTESKQERWVMFNL